MATLRAAPTGHRHTEQFSGITNTYLADTSRGGGGDERWEKNKAQNVTQLQQHFAKNCKQASAYIGYEVPLLEASGHP